MTGQTDGMNLQYFLFVASRFVMTDAGCNGRPWSLHPRFIGLPLRCQHGMTCFLLLASCFLHGSNSRYLSARVGPAVRSSRPWCPYRPMNASFKSPSSFQLCQLDAVKTLSASPLARPDATTADCRAGHPWRLTIAQVLSTRPRTLGGDA